MSDAAYSPDVSEAPESESEEFIELDGPEPEGDEDQPEAKAKDWEKVAADKELARLKERNRRREAERRAQALDERLQRLEQSQAPKSQGDDLVALVSRLRDDDEDPIGDLASTKAIARKLIAEQAAQAEQERQQQNQVQQVQRLETFLKESEDEFKADYPDYDEAAKFYREQRMSELEDEGWSGQRLNQKLIGEFLELVSNAAQNGRDPAEIVYKKAKRAGFGGIDKTVQKLQTIGKAQSASTSVTGGKSKVALTPAVVSKLKGDQFDKAFEALARANKRH